MIGIDVTPLLLGRRRGVARALLTLLEGWSACARPVPVVLMAPRPLTPGDALPALDGVVTAAPAVATARAFRRALPRLVEAAGVTRFLSPWLATPRLSVPTLVWVHELPFVGLGPIEGRLRALRQRAWLRRHERRGSHLVVPSAATRRDVITLRPGLAPRLTAIPHGFASEAWQAASRKPEVPAYAVVVGTGRGAAGAHKKGIDLIAPMRAALAGRLHVRVLGDAHVPDAELRRVVAGAHVLIYPSRSEGFGYPPLEAMGAGVPVVTTHAGSIPEVVLDAALCVAPGDAQALAAAALEAAFEAPVRARLIAAGNARASAFPPVAMAQAFDTCLAGLRTPHRIGHP